MNVCIDEICLLTASVWENVLGEPVVQSDGSHTGVEPLVGSVRVRGAWDGIVSVHCSPALAERAACALFGMTQVNPEDVSDVLGELANQVGGNIKAMLPGPSILSLPKVGSAATAEPAPDVNVALVREVWFECAGEPILVRVLATPPGYVTVPPA